MITIIIIGTVHETNREELIFDELNKQIELDKYKNIYWLCEGEQYGRKCISLKDNNLHLLTDALFVNMMLLDINNIKGESRAEFIKSLEERIIELFVTIKKSQFRDKIMEFKKKSNNFREFIRDIIELLLDNNIINVVHKKCIYDFYNTGHICENEIMTIMREKSFIKIILLFIMNLLKKKRNKIRIVITVGIDHVNPLKEILKGITNNIKIIV